MSIWCRIYQTAATFVFAVVIAAVILYTLWYVHNDHPLCAAILGGTVLTAYEFHTQWLFQQRDERIDELVRNQKRLLARLEEDEQHIEELTADEDDSTWG